MPLRPIPNTERAAYAGANAIGALFALPTCGLSLVATMSGSLLYNTIACTKYNNEYRAANPRI